MLHLLIVGCIDGMIAIDSLFKRKVKKVVHRFQELIDDPVSYLASDDVRIGPGYQYGTSVICGLFLGLMLSCGAFFGFLVDGKPGPKPLPHKILVMLTIISGPLLCTSALLYWLRGGEVMLRKDEVEFRLRNKSVVCPWALFNVPGELVWLNHSTLVMTANPQAVSDVAVRVAGVDTETGGDIRTKQFRFRRDSAKPVANRRGFPEIALRNIYRARLNEIGNLLVTLSRELAPLIDASVAK